MHTSELAAAVDTGWERREVYHSALGKDCTTRLGAGAGAAGVTPRRGSSTEASNLLGSCGAWLKSVSCPSLRLRLLSQVMAAARQQCPARGCTSPA